MPHRTTAEKRTGNPGIAIREEVPFSVLNGTNHSANTRLIWLLNHYTGELMELDRYYQTVGVAVEFSGAQHYEGTDLITFEKTVKQVGRDAMKAFICQARGIELAIIHPEDPRLKAIDQMIPGRLPRDLEGMETLVAALEEMASEYRERAAEEQARKGPRPCGGNGRPGA